MAIAKMKQMTLLAEQESKDQLLKAVQELQKLELLDLSTLEDSELFDYYTSETSTLDKRDYEEKLKEIQFTLTYLQQYIAQPGMITKLKKGRDEYTFEELESKINLSSIESIVAHVKEIEKRLIEIEQNLKMLADEELFLRKWQNLDFNPKELDDLTLTTGIVGTISASNTLDFKEAMKEAGPNYMEEIFNYKDEAAFLVITSSNEFNQLKEVLDKFQFTKMSYDYPTIPKEELKRNFTENKKIKEKQQQLKKELQAYKDSIKELELGEEYYYNRVQREIGKSLIMNGNQLFIINGWLEEEEVPHLVTLLDKYIGKESYAIIENDIKTKDVDFVPVVLKNNKFVEPFESVTEMYSLPKYDDVDPTPFMMPFYFVFFGMMSADIGYGLVLLVGTLAAMKLLKLDKGMAKFIRFFHLLSYSVIVWGIIYGSFFGLELPFQLLSTTDDVITILLLSVAFGFIQLVYGLILNGAVKWRKQERASSYIDGTAWVGILVGIGLLMLSMMVLENPIVTTISYILIGVNVLGILLVSALSSKKKGLGFAIGLYNLYGVTGYVGDLVSYTRLMALGVSGGSIAAAFNMIVDFLPPAAKFTIGIVLFILLHSLNIFLTYLSAYVHTARLQYVEFFGKFYEGGGHALAPLKTYEKHIYLKKSKK